MRVVVRINERTHPELYEELRGMEEGRAERLRALATSELRGQYYRSSRSSGKASSSPDSETPRPAAAPKENHESEPRADSGSRKALTQSVTSGF